MKQGRRSDNPPSAALARRLGQEAGKLRYLAPGSCPSDMTFGRFFNSAHVSPGQRYIYVKNDKVGSSFIIRSLVASEKRAQRIKRRTPFLERHRHPLLTPAELTRREWGEALRSYFVFTFCRNPYSRILSCYLDRIVDRDESYFVLQKRIGFPGGYRPAFVEFLEMLGEDGVLDLDTHWKPQHRNIAYDYYDYSYIGHFEALGEEFPRLLGWLYGRKARLGQVRKGTSAGSRIADHYDKRATELVRALYARDFALFGYEGTTPLDTQPKERHPVDFDMPRPRRGERRAGPLRGSETGRPHHRRKKAKKGGQ